MSNGLSPPTINRQPSGLLGFFGIKNGGRNPETLTPQLLAQVNLFQWYMQTNRRFARSTINVTATGFTLIFTVPLGETWYVEHLSYVSPVLGAGVTLETVAAFQDASNTRQVLLADSTGSRTTAAIYNAQARDFWLGPGESLGVYTLQLVAGPVNAGVLTVAYTPLAD